MVAHSSIAHAITARLIPIAGFASPRGTMQAAAVVAAMNTGTWPRPTHAAERLARAAVEVNIAARPQETTAAPLATAARGRSERVMQAVKKAPATGATNWLTRRTLGAKRANLLSTKSTGMANPSRMAATATTGVGTSAPKSPTGTRPDQAASAATTKAPT